MNPLAIITLLATVAQIGSSIAKSVSEDDDKKKQWAYARDQLALKNKDIEAANKASRRNALARAIKADTPVMPDKQRAETLAPEPASTQTADIIGGVGAGVNALATQNWKTPEVAAAAPQTYTRKPLIPTSSYSTYAGQPVNA
jgi:hypothetical protein